jgi:hypothetical protein
MKRMNPTSFTKQILNRIVFEGIVCECVGGGEEVEIFREDFDSPETEFVADCAIAFSCCLRKVDVGGEFDCGADTTSVVGFGGHSVVGM